MKSANRMCSYAFKTKPTHWILGFLFFVSLFLEHKHLNPQKSSNCILLAVNNPVGPVVMVMKRLHNQMSDLLGSALHATFPADPQMSAENLFIISALDWMPTWD